VLEEFFKFNRLMFPTFVGGINVWKNKWVEAPAVAKGMADKQPRCRSLTSFWNTKSTFAIAQVQCLEKDGEVG